MSISYDKDIACGKTSAEAGAIEFGRSLLGLFGLQQLVPNQASQDAANELTDARNNFSKIADQWNTAIENQKQQIVQSQLKYLSMQVRYNQTSVSIISETLAEQIESHSVLIGMLLVLVTFLILFDII